MIKNRSMVILLLKMSCGCLPPSHDYVIEDLEIWSFSSCLRLMQATRETNESVKRITRPNATIRLMIEKQPWIATVEKSKEAKWSNLKSNSYSKS